MTPSTTPGPLSRPFRLHRLGTGPSTVLVEATQEERVALAADFDLPAIHRLEGRFEVLGARDRITVTGVVSASLEQVCTVSLEPFPVAFEEPVDLSFASRDERTNRGAHDLELSPEDEGPDELVGDVIDLGAVTAEFLALGLDPYPRKPGIAFEQPSGAGGGDSPFGRLAALRRDDGDA